MNKEKKVLFIRGSMAASGYYQMLLPCTQLQKLGYTCDIINYETIDPDKMIGHKGIGNGKFVPYDLLKSDIVIFQLIVYEALNRVVRKLKETKIFTSMSIDDNYLNLPRSNPAYWSFHPKARTVIEDNKKVIKLYQEKVNPALDNMLKAMRTVDMLQVSTPELANLYKPLNDNIVVLENCINNSLYDKVRKPQNSKPVVAWSGTKTHIDDLYLIDGCIPENCILLIGGFPEVKDVGLFKYHPDIEFLPQCKFEEYPKMVAKADIVAIPLVDNKFNSCKSDLKGLEYGACSIPCVASDVAPYRRWVEHGINGFLASKTKHWLKYLKLLVEDKELRERMGKVAKEKAKERDISKYIGNWERTYFND